jgi:head-tail adaptor
MPVSLDGLLSETVDVVRYANTTDAYGDTVLGAESRVTYRARLEQLHADELIRDRDTVITDWRVFLPAAADVTAYDRIEGRGHLFEVVGLPNQHQTPRGPHHLEVLLRWVV